MAAELPAKLQSYVNIYHPIQQAFVGPYDKMSYRILKQPSGAPFTNMV